MTHEVQVCDVKKPCKPSRTRTVNQRLDRMVTSQLAPTAKDESVRTVIQMGQSSASAPCIMKGNSHRKYPQMVGTVRVK